MNIYSIFVSFFPVFSICISVCYIIHKHLLFHLFFLFSICFLTQSINYTTCQHYYYIFIISIITFYYIHVFSIDYYIFVSVLSGTGFTISCFFRIFVISTNFASYINSYNSAAPVFSFPHAGILIRFHITNGTIIVHDPAYFPVNVLLFI